MEETINTVDLLRLLQERISLFYLPYAPNLETMQEEYKWRKTILKAIEQRIDNEYNDICNERN